MKVSILALLCFISFKLSATTYYISPSGDDSRSAAQAQNISTPWRSLSKGWSALVAGDTLYVRGGTYITSGNISLNGKSGTASKHINIFNYPGEAPIFNWNGVVPSSAFNCISLSNVSYIHLKGIRVTNNPQTSSGAFYNYGIYMNSNGNNCIFENIEADHIGGTGFGIGGNCNGNLLLNCDSHHNDDPKSTQGAHENSNGFELACNVSGVSTIVRNCRAWWNGDDGFDTFNGQNNVTYEGCWSFWNGYVPGTFTAAGDGNGWKIGQYPSLSTQVLRTITNCLAVGNRSFGFDQNFADALHAFPCVLNNNTAYGNANAGFFFSLNLLNTLKNNVSYGNAGGSQAGAIGAGAVQANNSWNGGVTVNDADFQSVNSAGIDGPRQADGSLPNISFMKLASGSDLIDKGVNVSLPFLGNAPDLGAFETGGAAPSNQPPAAHAGTDMTMALPTNTANLDGSGTDPDGTIASYSWTEISGPACNIASPTNAKTSINNLAQGSYQFQLKVTDNKGATATDVVAVTVNAAPIPNVAPIAEAGNPATITLPTNSLTLTGSATDADGTVVSFAWTKISGPTQGTIKSPSNTQTLVNNLVQGTYKFQLQVTDNQGALGKDTVAVVVNAAPPPNQPPIADAGNDAVLTLPTNSLSVTGSATDADGTIASYSWSKIAGPSQFNIGSPASATTTITNLVQGVYQFQLQATDDDGATDVSAITVTVNAAPPPPANIPPVANAGSNLSITLPTSTLSLTGSGTDADGTIASYKWTKIAGPTQFNILSPANAQTTINSLVTGIYQFQLEVTDDDGATATDVVIATVIAAPINLPPVANAGSNVSITLPTSSVNLNGSGSDIDGTIASYSWTKVSGPSQYNIQSPASAQTTINNLAQGTYQFQLQVTDNAGGVANDIVVVTVNAAPPNQLPIADAGANITITLPANSTSLVGTGTDGDGTIANYEWKKTSGPTKFNLLTPTNSQTTVDSLVQGVYQFELKVVDNVGGSATDNVLVTVNAAAPPPNQVPLANAGNDLNITLPTNSVSITGSGSDGDGTVSTYAWTKIAGPSQYNIQTPAGAQTTINNLVQGVYQFQLQVTDNGGATANDIVIVTVNAALPNQAPNANAGSDVQITLPINSVNLTGVGTDADGTIATYSWTKISGPTQFAIGSPNAAQTAMSNLVQGIYYFQLKVTDDDGSTDVDVVRVTVKAAPVNQRPIAHAGNNKNITLPSNIVSLSGSGTDADGTITTYKWTKISGPSQYNIAAPTTSATTIDNMAQGSYQFELEVTDDDGATGTDVVTVTVNAAPINLAPVAVAGSNKTITLPVNSVTLNGSGTDVDGTIATYAWTKIAGPTQFTIVSPANAQTTINNLAEGVYQFQLQVTDNAGATATDVVFVTVNAAAPPPNQAPTAIAGSNTSITLPTNSLILNGSGTDPDGTITTYSWTKISGPTQFNIVTAGSAQTTVNNLIEGVYQFQLQVTDNGGATATDIVIVTVNPAPINQAPGANAGTDISITLPISSVTLNGSGTDADGTIASYAWTRISGPASANIVTPLTAQTTVNNLTEGVYQFQLQVTDNGGATGLDIVNVTVIAAPVNQLPIASAGNDLAITLPTSSVALTGSGSDADGTITGYQWTKLSGPTQFNIVSSSAAQTTINNLTQGVYQFELEVTDNSGAKATDVITITVNAAPSNQNPVANAGSNISITLPVSSVSLNGNGSDADGTIASYAWTKIAGPTQYTIAAPASAQTGVNNLVQGVYYFMLTVTDNAGGTAVDFIKVTVIGAAPNQAPVANAGNNKVITLPTNSVSVTGSGTDADGTIASYSWTKISGPAQFNIQSPANAQTTINNLVEGVYQFQLKVTDNAGGTSTDEMQVTVNAAPAPPPNVAPIANAGNNISITLPVNSVSLSGSGTDADGTVTGYSWTKIAGPGQYNILASSSAQTTVSNLVEGVYQFQLQVTDNSGGTGTDIVFVTVNPAINQLPLANAGNNVTITLPTNSLTLSGGGTDADGTITTYSWTKVGGPGQYNILSSSSAQTTINNLVQGIYQFQLKVTDNDGGTAVDVVTVTVNAAPPNQAPNVNAGSNITITLPTDSVSLTGSATDVDGSIAGYHWTKISGPSQFTIVSADAPQTKIRNLVAGVYYFMLEATDDDGSTAWDLIKITVRAEPANQLPVADAGSNLSINLPTNSVAITGTGTDGDGTIVTYSWTKVSGPNQFTIQSPSSGQTIISNLVQGSYQFQLEVTDNRGGKATDIVTVNVNSAPLLNLPPSVNAGTDITINLPTNFVAVKGNATDADGTVVSYAWTKISGPAQFDITAKTSASTTITNLEEGIYEFQLQATDNSGASGKDIITITVNAAPPATDLRPIADAGDDMVVVLPTNTITLQGKGTDPDGVITGYYWNMISGPTTYHIDDRESATSTISGLAEGTYQFELTVTDNNRATDTDTLTVQVKDIDISTASIYPNPVTDIMNLSIESKALSTPTVLTIYDMSGRAVYQEEFIRTQRTMIKQINVSRLTNGTYIVKVGADLNTAVTIKMLKQ